MNKQQITQLYNYFKKYGNCSGNYKQFEYTLPRNIIPKFDNVIMVGVKWIIESYELIYSGKQLILVINGKSKFEGYWTKLDIRYYNLIELEEIHE